MTDSFEWRPETWAKSGGVFQEIGPKIESLVAPVVQSTTDPNACGAGKGLATVDGAVATLLGIFGGVMQETIPEMAQTVSGVGEAMTTSSEEQEQTEQANVEQAESVREGL